MPACLAAATGAESPVSKVLQDMPLGFTNKWVGVYSLTRGPAAQATVFATEFRDSSAVTRESTLPALTVTSSSVLRVPARPATMVSEPLAASVENSAARYRMYIGDMCLIEQSQRVLTPH